jgi:predicted kinase
VLSTDAARALAAAVAAVGALRLDPGSASVVAEIDQARAAWRKLPSDDPMAQVLDQVLIEVLACRLASRRGSPQLDATVRRALVVARAQGHKPDHH